ncbi:MAG: SLC13 family permease [Gammaproteobacteria bacterium]
MLDSLFSQGSYSILMLAILAITIILFISQVIRPDVVAVLVLVMLGLTGLLPVEQLYSGFSNEAVISLISVMIISAGLDKTGLAIRASRFILNVSKEKPNRIFNLMMVTAGVLSSFMRTMGAVSILLPIVTRISLRTGIAKARLLMPMAFCAVLGGAMTVVGSGTLIILNSILNNVQQFLPYERNYNLNPLSLFEIFPIGLAFLSSGILYFNFISKKFFPETEKLTQHGSPMQYFSKTYNKGGEIYELKIQANSPLVNLNLKDLEIRLENSLSLIALYKDKTKELNVPPLRKTQIQAGDSIALMGQKQKILEFANLHQLRVAQKLNVFAESLNHTRAGLNEVVIPPSSRLIGQPVSELHMRRNYQVQVLALYRDNTVYSGEDLNTINLKAGDTLGVFCRWDAFAEFSKNPDFVVVTSVFPREEIRPRKLPAALFFALLTLFMLIFTKYPASVVLLCGAAGMIASGALSVDEAYKAVSWQTVFLIAGVLPLGLVLEASGIFNHVQDYLSFLKQFNHYWIQLLFALLATFCSLVISNVGATVLLVPLALSLASNFGLSPKLLATTVALSASNTFIFINNQVNTLIAGPGGYTKQDFLKIGSGLMVINWLLIIFVLPLVFKG